MHAEGLPTGSTHGHWPQTAPLPGALSLASPRLACGCTAERAGAGCAALACVQALLKLPLGGSAFSGDSVIARYYARLGGSAETPSTLYGTPGDALSATAVDQWIERAASLVTAAGADLQSSLAALNRCAVLTFTSTPVQRAHVHAARPAHSRSRPERGRSSGLRRPVGMRSPSG